MRYKLAFLLPFLLAPPLWAGDTLDIYCVDTEGGKAVVLLSPAGESMLIDGGFRTMEDRDLDRIVEVVRTAGIKQFDYVVTTHYDSDHVGNVPYVDVRVPGGIFVDHGPVMPGHKEVDLFTYYLRMIGDRKRLSVKPGDTIPLKGVRLTVLTSGGEVLSKPLAGAGKPNQACAAAARPDKEDLSENAGSLGLLFEFGKFRMVDMGDLTVGPELKLMCPDNRVGVVDLFMVSHHGLAMSNSQPFVHGLRPKVAIMNNGPKKGGAPEVFKTLRASPGLQDIWQLHYSPEAGKELNARDDFIANTKTVNCENRWIKVSVRPSGAYTVTNARTGFSKTYEP